MNGNTAALVFLGVCLVLAVLLLTRTTTPILSGSIFAVALVILGGLSRGFSKRDQNKDSKAN